MTNIENSATQTNSNRNEGSVGGAKVETNSTKELLKAYIDDHDLTLMDLKDYRLRMLKAALIENEGGEIDNQIPSIVAVDEILECIGWECFDN